MLNIALIGAGSRGWRLARTAAEQSSRARMFAVVDPVASHCEAFAAEFSLPKDKCFDTHAEFLRQCPDVDGAIVASSVASHAAIACDCLNAGVPIFLEKPMALDLDQARSIVQTAEQSGTQLHVGLNCRYAPFFVMLKEIMDNGELGGILSIEWKETITPQHWAEYCRHPSYNRRGVLGSWLLEKCSHDIDLLNWIVDTRCERVASFGSRSHFGPRSDVPEQCSPECPIESECLFSAAKLYGDKPPDDTGLNRIMPHICVYHSGSDLVDHQTALLEYANGVTVAFSLLSLAPEDTRRIRICGSNATLRGCWARNELRVHRLGNGEEIVRDPGLSTEGHGGADPEIMVAFLDWLEDPSRRPKTAGAEGLEAMVVCEGIDLAMRERRVVELDELRASGNH